jgi:hypothetical protein
METNKDKNSQQTIKTENTKIIEKKNEENREVLIGKKIEKVKEIEEGFDNLQKRILEKIMK